MIKLHYPLDEHSTRLLHQAIAPLGLLARAYSRILKIARPIADLEALEQITSTHIAEAISSTDACSMVRGELDSVCDCMFTS